MDFGPAGEGFGEQLGTVGAVERRLATSLAMLEGEDRVAGGVERREPSTRRRGPIRALPRHEGGDTDEQCQGGRDGNRHDDSSGDAD